MKREVCSKDTKIEKISVENKKIVLKITEEKYNEIVNDNKSFKAYLSCQLKNYPELFPKQINAENWSLNGFVTMSKKQNYRLGRIKLTDGSVWQVHVSFLMPYMSCKTEDASKYLFLLRWCPYWALTEVFGRNDMFYYRLHQHFGAYSMVGTTIKDSSKLPKHLLGDEKHSKINGEKVYLAITCGDDCFLGASISSTASEEDLTVAYGGFMEEAKQLSQDYTPETINTDGWFATIKAWKNIFPLITVIQCFLHAVLKIKNVATKNTQALFKEILDKAWNAYKAENKRSFSQRIRRLKDFTSNMVEGKLKIALDKLCSKRDWFSVSYDYNQAHRTSNMIDRLINKIDRKLYTSKWWHGTKASAEKGIRAFCLIQNFSPYCPRVQKKYDSKVSAFEKLNGHKYAENWLENLIIATSVQPKYKFQQKKLE